MISLDFQLLFWMTEHVVWCCKFVLFSVLYVGEKGYWEGRVGNSTGWFQHSYVQEKKGKGTWLTCRYIGLFPISLAVQSRVSRKVTQKKKESNTHIFMSFSKTIFLSSFLRGFERCVTPCITIHVGRVLIVVSFEAFVCHHARRVR